MSESTGVNDSIDCFIKRLIPPHCGSRYILICRCIVFMTFRVDLSIIVKAWNKRPLLCIFFFMKFFVQNTTSCSQYPLHITRVNNTHYYQLHLYAQWSRKRKCYCFKAFYGDVEDTCIKRTSLKIIWLVIVE